VQYTKNTSQLHDKDIAECNSQLWTIITRPAPQRFHIQFPSGKLTTFVPRNARNDRIYYQRVPTSICQTSIYWFTLSINVAQPLQTPKPSVRVINWGYSHLLEHKDFFVPHALKSHFSSIIYRPITMSNPSMVPYNHTFPIGVTLEPLQLQDRLPHYRTVCTEQQSHMFIQPYGKLKIKLRKIRPPTNKNVYCQELPNPTTPTTSYINLESFVNNRTHSPLTFFSWSTSLDDHQHQNLTRLLSNSTTSLPELLQKKQQLTEATHNYTSKLNQALMDARFAEFHVHYFEQSILQRNRSDLRTHFDEEQQQIAENNLFSHQQYIHMYAKILWRIHFIRQNILQQALTMWRNHKSFEYLKTSTSFEQNFIYEHTLIGDTLYSTNVFRSLGDRSIERRFTIPELSKHETYWTPQKLTALISGTVALGTAVFYGIYNYFCTTSQITSEPAIYAKASLAIINNRTL